jgi:alpha-D-xyloside xylohydrolase
VKTTVHSLWRAAACIALLCTSLLPATGAHAAPVEAVKTLASGIEVGTRAGVLRVEPWTDRIVRVRFARSADWPGNDNPALLGGPAPVAWTVDDSAAALVLSTSAMKVRVDKGTGALTFLDRDGSAVLTEPGWGRGAPGVGVSQNFDLQANEAIYGLGQHQAGALDYKGSEVLLQQINTDVGVPMVVSSKGYGLLWNNAAVTHVDVASPRNAYHLSLRSEAGEGIDYHFIYGPDIDDVVAGYRRLTGQAPMMARWTWGLWQSRERYATQEELLSVVKRYRDTGMPLDAVVQDWQYWAPGGWGSHEFDRARFPDPAAMVKAIHGQHAHVIISVWPRFDLGTANHDELKKAGALYEPVFHNVYPAGEGRWYDAWSPAGRQIYWRQVMDRLGRLGFDGWWLDGSEAELGGQAGQMAGVLTAAGPGAKVFNAYPLMHTTAVHDGMRRDMPDKRVFILTRSAYAGQQRNGAITWSGDIAGTWDVLAKQIPAGLNFSVSGIPYWSADIGGFFGGDPKDPDYAELFTRWYQFAVFNPMFRVHGTGAGKEPWAFDAATQKRLKDYAALRYRLLPYIYSTSWEVTSRAGTMMRPLVMDFRTDAAVLTVRDQYMFGRALLVSPVVQPHADVRTVVLPQGTWYDFWTGERLSGGRVVVARADIGTIPVHVRAGAILPLGPDVSYADQETTAPLELRVYPGRNGSFELYDDEGDGHGYERGARATIALAWDDASRTLRIGARQGQFPGMAVRKAMRVRCATGHESVPVDYTGAAVSVKMDACGP